MSVWRCRVCEAVNQSGRTCTTCGSTVPAGEPLRAAVRTRIPAATPPRVAARRTASTPPPPPVPPTPTRRDLRALPTLEDMLLGDPSALFMPGTRMAVRPMPGGCLMAPVPVRRRRRRSFWY